MKIIALFFFMAVSIHLPVDQDQITSELKRLSEERERLRNEIDSVNMLIKAVRDCCSHPQTYRGGEYGLWPYTKCKICNKEW